MSNLTTKTTEELWDLLEEKKQEQQEALDNGEQHTADELQGEINEIDDELARR